MAVVMGANMSSGARAEQSAIVLPESPATAMDQTLGLAANSPVLAADPDQPRFVALAYRFDAPQFSCGLALSGDGGHSWLPARPIVALPEGAERCYGPDIAFGPHGRLYFAFVGLAGAGNEPVGAYVAYSDDRGATFSVPTKVLGPGNFGVRMAVDAGLGELGRVHLAWLHTPSDPPLGGFGSPPNPIQSAFSDDGGATFSVPVGVSPDPARLLVAPSITMGADHAVHVSYYDLGDDRVDYLGLEGPTWTGSWSLVVSTSVDQGQTFATTSVVDDAITPSERVMLIFTMAPASVVSANGRLCAAWTDARNGDADAMLRCSDDGAKTWGPLVRLNDDAVGNGIRQYLPRLAIDAGGRRVQALFYDRRDDPSNIRNHVRLASSLDGGRSFSPNVRITSEDSDSRTGQQYEVPSAVGQYEIGSRLGLIMLGDRALAAWTDSRNSQSVIGAVGQDVFTAVVVLPASGGRSGTGIVVLGAAAALVAVGVYVSRRRRADSGRASARPPTEAGRVRITALVAVVVFATMVACSPSGDDSSANTDARPLPPTAPEVVVRMSDFRFDVESDVPSGRVVFRVVNEGAADHLLVLLRLPADFGPIAEQLRGDQRRSVTSLAGVPVRRPGTPGVFAVDLDTTNRYAILCTIVDPDGQSHAQKGMAADLRVG